MVPATVKTMTFMMAEETAMAVPSVFAMMPARTVTSDNTGIFVAVARVLAVDVAAAAADRGDNNAGCNEDPFKCASPAAAVAAPLLPAAGAMPGQRAIPPLLGDVAYFSSSLDNKDKDNKDNNDVFEDGDAVEQEVGWWY